MQHKSLGLVGQHSLTCNDITWLYMTHEVFGKCLILQRNFGCEAVLIPDLCVLFVLRLGKGQERVTQMLLGWLHKYRTEIHQYSNQKTVFSGFNLHFPSPFHTIASGLPALMRISEDLPFLRASGYLAATNVWFDPRRLYPSLIFELVTDCLSGRPLEPWLEMPGFLMKPAHGFKANEEPFNRRLDMLLLASSSSSEYEAQDNHPYTLWVGLTSGKRSLVNEPQILRILFELLLRKRNISRILVDGWTGSSIDKKFIDVPEAYKSHDAEVEVIHSIAADISTDIIVTSLVGCCYEEKVRSAFRCDFSFTSAYTASIVPSRICSLPGIVHASNRALSNLRMHVYRRSVFVPSELIEDQDFGLSASPHDVSWKINERLFAAWLEELFMP